MNGYILAADVAHMRKITLNHVYQLAHIHRWRRIRTSDGRVQYHVKDVIDTLTSQDATESANTP